MKYIGKYLKTTDLYLLFLSLICSGFGLVLIYSATYSLETKKYLVVQAAAIGLGLVCFVIASLIDIDHISPLWKWLYVFNILLLGSLYFFGVSGDTGNKSWIRFMGIGIQPAEFGKIIFVFTLSQHINLLREKLSKPSSVLQLLIHAGLVIGCIIVFSGDMGMALAYCFIFVAMLFAAGLHWTWFASGAAALIPAIPLLWNYVLKGYMKTRILVLFDPTIDKDVAHQGVQSKIALGAGQLTGQGFLQGRQTQYSLLPAKRTDFIFSVCGEEFGFIGCMAIISLLTLLILRIFYVSFKAKSTFSFLACVGIGSMFLFQSVLNIAMCAGVAPVIGLTLPFFSYGGSSIVTMYAAVGMVAGVRMRERPVYPWNK